MAGSRDALTGRSPGLANVGLPAGSLEEELRRRRCGRGRQRIEDEQGLRVHEVKQRLDERVGIGDAGGAAPGEGIEDLGGPRRPGIGTEGLDDLRNLCRDREAARRASCWLDQRPRGPASRAPGRRGGRSSRSPRGRGRRSAPRKPATAGTPEAEISLATRIASKALSSVKSGPVKRPTWCPATTATARPAASASAWSRPTDPRNRNADAGTLEGLPRISFARATAVWIRGGSG